MSEGMGAILLVGAVVGLVVLVGILGPPTLENRGWERSPSWFRWLAEASPPVAVALVWSLVFGVAWSLIGGLSLEGVGPPLQPAYLVAAVAGIVVVLLGEVTWLLIQRNRRRRRHFS